ncbi:transporter substrate-binding domain-containing protein [Arsenicitalea aurantiaca]|uniref:transporter substrate-binding domain-containing protein n=1 Tax=Arsenicitalea aurantiaca TaxID=1783274 RepID=UPI0013150F2C|nr:transporter substrate-binding domain-containing protein [Arsenicitalea aurantiaca]
MASTNRPAWASLARKAMLTLVAAATLLGAGAARAQTLETVRERGYLICATTDALSGFAQMSPEGQWSGFDYDFCRAVATAVFGDPEKLRFYALSGAARFALLANGAIDVMARNGVWTMRRDTAYGAAYVGTSFFDGQSFLVPQSLGVVSAYELDGVSVCVVDGGEEIAKLREFFFSNQAAYREVRYEDREDLSVAYRSGLCDAVSAPASWLHAIRRGLPEPATHRILPERIAKGAFGPVVREGDAQWFDIVKWTLYGLIDAEEAGVTSLNIDSLSAAKTQSIRRLLGLEGDFGPSMGLERTFIANVIRAVGNYGEIFERSFGASTGAAVLRGQNALWTNGGQLYAPPVR